MTLFGSSLHFTASVKRYREFFARNRTSLIAVTILILVSLAVLRVDRLTNPPVNQDRLDEQSQTLKKVNFDEESINAIRKLRDSNVDVRPDLPGDRQNPFSE